MHRARHVAVDLSPRHTLLGVMGAAVLLLSSAGAQGQQAAPDTSKDALLNDTAVLELNLPEGATVVINDRDYGMRRTFTWRALTPRRTYEMRLRVRFAGGGEEERLVFLEGGRRVRLAMLAPDTPSPDMVLQTGHTDSVLSVAFSPDGRWLASASAGYDESVRLWDAETGRELRRFQHTGPVVVVAFSPNGRRLASGGQDDTVRLWDVETGRELRRFEGHARSVESVAFSPDGRRLASASRDGTVLFWDAETGRELRRFEGEPSLDQCVVFSPDGRQLATANGNETVIWNVETGRELRRFEGHTSWVRDVAFSPDGRRLASASDDHTVRLWEVETGRELERFEGHAGEVLSVAFSPDGRQLASGSWDSTVCLWDTETGRDMERFQGHTSRVFSVAFNGRLIASASYDGTLRLWDAETGRELRRLEGHTSGVETVASSPDGRRLASAGWDNTVRLWDTATGRELERLQGHTSIVSAVAFSADGRWLASASYDHTVCLWDVETDRELRRFEGHMDSVVTVAFSHNGRRLASASDDDTVRLWDAETGRELQRFDGNAYSVAFSPDGRRLASASGDAVRLWDTTTGEELLARSFNAQPDIVVSVAFSPDGNSLASASDDGTMRLWDIETGRELRRFEGHTDNVWSVAFSPNGRQLASASTDETVRLWDAETGRELRCFEGHAGMVFGVTFGPHGRRLASASADGTVRLWDIATGDEVARLVNLLGEGDWVVVTPEGLFDGSEGGRQLVSWRVGGGLNVVPVDRFFQDFYRPGLLTEIWRGERPLPAMTFDQVQPAPTVRIVSPEEGGAVDDRQITLEVEAVDQGGGVQPPWLVHNGARIHSTARTEAEGGTVRRRFTVTLIEGENRLECHSASADGSWESEPAVIVLRYERPIDRPNLYVLAVGIDRYARGAMNLRFARDDAEAIVELFEERGPALYEDVYTVALFDDEATREGIRDALNEIAEQARPQDTLVVFLAGHGSVVGQRYYFLTHEFEQQAERREEDVRQQGLAADVLGDYLAAVPALKRVLIFDTCHSGGALQLAARDPFALRGAIERLSRAQGVFTIAAAPAGDEAEEVQELGHGILTYALLAGMRAAEGGPLEGQYLRPGNPDRVAYVLEWFSFASGQVPRLTEQYFGRAQDVQMSGHGTSFPLLPLEVN